MSSSHVRQVPESVAHFDREIKMEGKRQTGRAGWIGGGGGDDWPDGEGGGQKRPQGPRNVFEGSRKKVMEQFVSLDCERCDLCLVPPFTNQATETHCKRLFLLYRLILLSQ